MIEQGIWNIENSDHETILLEDWPYEVLEGELYHLTEDEDSSARNVNEDLNEPPTPYLCDLLRDFERKQKSNSQAIVHNEGEQTQNVLDRLFETDLQNFTRKPQDEPLVPFSPEYYTTKEGLATQTVHGSDTRSFPTYDSWFLVGTQERSVPSSLDNLQHHNASITQPFNNAFKQDTLIIVAYFNIRLPCVYPPPNNTKRNKCSFSSKTILWKALRALSGR